MIFSPGNTSFWDISQKNIDSVIQSLDSKRQDLGFIDIDKNIDIAAIQSFVSESWNSFDNIVVLWIWWSALWTKALLESLHWKYYNEIADKKWKNIYVLDNIDPETFIDIEQLIDISKTLFVFISKSGNTIETLSEYVYFREKLKRVSNNWKQNFCFIVGENCSMRTKLEEDFSVFTIAENIWGRFSVFTPVWLLPLAFSWVDISEFISAISKNKQKYLCSDLDGNLALQLAYTQFEYYKQWKNIAVFFPYSSRLFQVWEWYKQLMWESIGKAWEGITLTSSLWVTDQHSQIQLYQDGPRDKLFITAWIQQSADVFIDPSMPWYSFKKLLEIEKYGTITSLQNEGIPVCDITLESLNAQSIAELLYTLMFQIAYLWELFEINAFDQPWVEKSKILIKQKLATDFPDIDIFNRAFYD